MRTYFTKIMTYLKDWIQRSLILFIFLGLWEVLPASGLIDRAFLPQFSEVAAALVKMIFSGELTDHLIISLERAFLGFALAVLVAIPLGILMGWYKMFERFVDPLMQAFRNTSTLALYPVFILFLGIGEASKIAILFKAALWPILINTISGVKNVDPLLIKSARSMAVSNVFIFRKVVLPSSIPSIASGVRLGASISLVVLVAAEMIGAKSGLGFLIINSQYNFMIPEMYAAIVTLVLLGLVLNYSLVWLEKKATGWREEINN